jgi:hypothetical protein
MLIVCEYLYLIFKNKIKKLCLHLITGHTLEDNKHLFPYMSLHF